MPQRLFKPEQLLALLLPLTLFLSWAACLAFCEENAAHQDAFSHSAAVKSASDCLDLNVETESCPATATAVIFQERQTVKETALAAAFLPEAAFRAAPPAQALRSSEIKQHSPPKIQSKPLFLRFGALRI